MFSPGIKRIGLLVFKETREGGIFKRGGLWLHGCVFCMEKMDVHQIQDDNEDENSVLSRTEPQMANTH